MVIAAILGVDKAVRLGVTDEVEGLGVRRSVSFLLRSTRYGGQVALLLHFVPHLIALLVGYA
jgi:hypothetical protein